MKNCIWKITKSLCAAFLVFAILACFAPTALGAEESSTEETTTATTTLPATEEGGSKDYVYNINVEFGYFSFYYDWGVWNTQTFRYHASDSSANPGAGTMPGTPGWYGFDGINNRIFVENKSLKNAQNEELTVRFYFDGGWDIDGEPFPVTGIEMECFVPGGDKEHHDWLVPNEVRYEPQEDGKNVLVIDPNPVYLMKMETREGLYRVDNGNYDVTLSKQGKATIYISFKGAPKLKPIDRDGSETDFIGTTMTKIGFLTITLEPKISEGN